MEQTKIHERIEEKKRERYSNIHCSYQGIAYILLDIKHVFW